MSVFPYDNEPLETAASLRRLADDIERLTMFMPSSELEGAPVLIDWRPDGRMRPCLTGTTTGHPRIRDGRNAVTSEIFAMDPHLRWVRTMSRYYLLDLPRGS